MARRHRHEEHVNHEAWAIPYGDLMTLLLAFFVVMYAISSVNEGKYRQVSDSLSAAFGGPPKSTSPIQIGQVQPRSGLPGSPMQQPQRQPLDPADHGRKQADAGVMPASIAGAPGDPESEADARGQLDALGTQIQNALAGLIDQKLVTIKRGPNFIEVQIQSDILFASGVAIPSQLATDTVRKLGAVLSDAPNALRIEGYTDDQPIRTPQYPSNWELSAARAASVVRVLADQGINPERLAVVGYGEHHALGDNATQAGRNANRRVMLVILAASQGTQPIPSSDTQAVAADHDVATRMPATVSTARRATQAAAADAPVPTPSTAPGTAPAATTRQAPGDAP